MGCCEARNDLQFNIKSEIQGKRDTETMRRLNSLQNNTNNICSIQSCNSRISNDNQIIPQLKQVKLPTSKIPPYIIKTKKHLQLTIFESKFLPEGKVLIINPGGLIGSERNAQDGITIFGVSNSHYLNDFNFPEDEVNIGMRHFEIKYDINSDDYKIINLSGSGLYIKITNKALLRNNAIFSFSSTLISIKIAIDTNNMNGTQNNNHSNNQTELLNSILTLKVIYGINQNKEITIESNKKQIIKLGRFKTPEIDLDFKDESTSRIQTTIIYENNNWYIMDGDGLKSSLNGTWYFADEYISITENMIFRAGTTSFNTHYILQNIID